jgi:hypothetical protein
MACKYSLPVKGGGRREVPKCCKYINTLFKQKKLKLTLAEKTFARAPRIVARREASPSPAHTHTHTHTHTHMTHSKHHVFRHTHSLSPTLTLAISLAVGHCASGVAAAESGDQSKPGVGAKRGQAAAARSNSECSWTRAGRLSSSNRRRNIRLHPYSAKTHTTRHDTTRHARERERERRA